MPLWGTGYPGSNSISALNFLDLRPGDDLALLDGTETVATGSASIAFARGYDVSGGNDCTFSVTGCASGSAGTIDIQGSNGVSVSGRNPTPTPTLANMDASFVKLATITGNGVYTETQRFEFYRAVVSSFASGDAPVIIVKR